MCVIQTISDKSGHLLRLSSVKAELVLCCLSALGGEGECGGEGESERVIVRE